MLLKRRLVERYVLGAVLPYFILSLIFLTVALIAQQTTRFADILGAANAPLRVAAEVLTDLLPAVLVFTIPTSALVGTVIGFGRMNGDSELVALRAAGVGKYKIAFPPLMLGALLCLVTYLLGFEVAPAAANDLRRVVASAALKKLESPVEPRTFFTDLPGKVLFVREGLRESGQWGRVFIHWMESDGVLRVVTARGGRIDASGGQSELVLNEARVLTIPSGAVRAGGPEEAGVSSENSSLLRMKDERLEAGRQEILRRVEGRELGPEEMGWDELRASIRGTQDPRRRATLVSTFHRRMALCLAPLVFTLLGTGLGMSTRRGGRGYGMVASVVVLLLYYLLTLGGENLGRGGVIPQALGGWAANALMLSVGLGLLLFSEGRNFVRLPLGSLLKQGERAGPKAGVAGGAGVRLNWGLMDRHVLRALGRYFVIAFGLLVSVFLIFTLFDLFRFVSSREGAGGLIARYILFLVPFAAVAMAPMAVLVAVLGAYALMARRSEAVAWWASGVSAYRLAVPGLIFACAAGGVYWAVQEQVLPQTNRVQNALRAQIRGRAQASTGGGREWISTPDMRVIYTYALDPSGGGALVKPLVYEFEDDGVHLRRVVFGERGEWRGEDTLSLEGAAVASVRGDGIELSRAEGVVISAQRDLFKPTLSDPLEMTAEQLSESLNSLRRRNDPNSTALAMSLVARRADPLSPLVLALIGMPLAFAFGRRSALAALCSAILIGLLFWFARGLFFNLGVRGYLPVAIAAWVPGVSFGALGTYLLTRTRT
jgi:LPS export ABC transporter permease LptG